jgi:hypothetical protein
MTVDATGRTIEVGDRVRHAVPPCDVRTREGHVNGTGCCHNFGGSSVVEQVGENIVRVRKTGPHHIPFHLPDLLVVL